MRLVFYPQAALYRKGTAGKCVHMLIYLLVKKAFVRIDSLPKDKSQSRVVTSNFNKLCFENF